ncbi:hypothetical protein BFR40_09695 [Brochothrix thermosphacta]|uniref:two-component system histidine kinase PnpS n=1 Tax=Brochothrix thermosphacta TaxID=2756 RepID=UPI00083FCA8E|nr:HAMP domain-containing histidine kinase [Brochothrix thermosphacta]ODJ50344.1 hypothetical protein BFR40_09695 [Brochothrix thermosphacta]SPN74891.1 putative two-component sensor histidine kinase(PhoR) [Brochothrix thermosphacta]
MKPLWQRLVLVFCIITILVVGVLGFFSASIIKRNYIENREAQMLQSAKLMIENIEAAGISIKEPNEALNAQLHKEGGLLDSRLTIVDKAGNVIADTEEDYRQMGNHKNRPEIKALLLDKNLTSASNQRQSSSLGYSMLYTAVPIMEDGKLVGFMRVAVSLELIESAITQLQISLIIMAGVIIVVATLVIIIMVRRIARPITTITDVTHSLAEKDYSQRVMLLPSGEIGELAKSVNLLGEKLQKNVSEIQEKELRLTGVLNNLVSGVLLVNMEHRITLANPAMFELMEKNPLNHNYFEVLPSYQLSNLIKQAFKTGDKQQAEVILYGHNSEKRVDANVVPIQDKHNQRLTGVILVLHDITEIRHLETLRSEFVSNVSHELKTPVTSIKGFSETLLDGAVEDPELRKEFLTIIRDESNRLTRLIEDILQLSKIEQQQIKPHFESVDFVDVVQRVLKVVRKPLKEKRIELVLNLPESYPLTSESDGLHQIALNLISNAITYTPANGRIELSIENAVEQAHVVFRVSDTGIGIPEDDQQRVFERFYRVHKSRERETGGTGLGLSIVKHLVERYHGEITLTSVEDEGTTFEVILPTHPLN